MVQDPKYGNKKCIQFKQSGSTTLSGIGPTGYGYGLVAETPLSFSAGTFGNGGGANAYEFSYSFWLKKNFTEEASTSDFETIYHISKATASNFENHTRIQVRSYNTPSNRGIQFLMDNGPAYLTDRNQYIWGGNASDNPATAHLFNGPERWLHFVITCNGDLTDPAGVTLYVNSISSSAGLVLTSAIANPPTVNGEGSPDTDTDTWNWQSLGVARPDDNITPVSNAGDPLNGKLGNFAIWNKMLSQNEVTAIYNDGRLIDLNTTSMATNLIQWNKCGNYYQDVNPSSTSDTTTASFNVANHASAPEPSGNLNLIRGIGYGPTYNLQIVDDPVSTDMLLMEGFDRYGGWDVVDNDINSLTVAAGGVDILGVGSNWGNTDLLDPQTYIALGGLVDQGNTYQTHWPKPWISTPTYVNGGNSTYLGFIHSHTGNSAGDGIYRLFNSTVTSGTVNIGFAYRGPSAGPVAYGTGRKIGVYWGDSTQAHASSSQATGRLFLWMQGRQSGPVADNSTPRLCRSTGAGISSFTELARGASGSLEIATCWPTPLTFYPGRCKITGTDRYWYWVEMEIYPAPTGSFKLFLNNSPIPAINYVGDTRGVGNSETIDFLGFSMAGTSNMTYFLDDIVSFHNKKAIEQYCLLLRPNTENFTGSFTSGSSAATSSASDCLTSINDTLISRDPSFSSQANLLSTGTFMYTTTDPDSASFGYTNPPLPFTSNIINGVQAHNLINMDGVTFTSIQNNLITGSTGLITGSYLTQSAPGSWQMVSELYSRHPTSSVNTSVEFTNADLNAIIDELKVK